MYRVHPDSAHEALRRLSGLRDVGLDIAQHVRGPVGRKLQRRLKRAVLAERPSHTSQIAVTMNKRHIAICLRDRDGHFEDKDIALRVFLHELAHVVSDSVGHTKEFYENEALLVTTAIRLGHAVPQKRHVRFCDTNVILD